MIEETPAVDSALLDALETSEAIEVGRAEAAVEGTERKELTPDGTAEDMKLEI